LSGVIVSVLSAAAAAGDDDTIDTADICCDCLSEIAKGCKLASINRECSISDVSAAAAAVAATNLT
jgi:hypothetical protein